MRLRIITEAEYYNGERVRWRDRVKLLLQYRGNPQIFVTFTYINKLGINPQTKYKTPVGIYAYPVNYVIAACTGGVKKDKPNLYGTITVPFAQHKPFMQVFAVKDLANVVQLSKSSPKDLVKQIRASKRKNIPTFPLEKEIAALAGLDEATLANYKKLAAKGRLTCDFDLVWQLTRIIANGGQYLLNGHTDGNPSKWTSLLMGLGIKGIVDNGTGTIHPNESTQAIFFKLSDLKHLDTIRNTLRYNRDDPDYNEYDFGTPKHAEDNYKAIHLGVTAELSRQGNFGSLDHGLRGLTSGHFAHVMDSYDLNKTYDKKMYDDLVLNLNNSIRHAAVTKQNGGQAWLDSKERQTSQQTVAANIDRLPDDKTKQLAQKLLDTL